MADQYLHNISVHMLVDSRRARNETLETLGLQLATMVARDTDFLGCCMECSDHGERGLESR